MLLLTSLLKINKLKGWYHEAETLIETFIELPTQDSHILRLLHLYISKTRETAFLVLNITFCTNDKEFKSSMREGPNCEQCGLRET
jgi:hypothetical protein